jgi:hypothetical protein
MKAEATSYAYRLRTVKKAKAEEEERRIKNYE